MGCECPDLTCPVMNLRFFFSFFSPLSLIVTNDSNDLTPNEWYSFFSFHILPLDKKVQPIKPSTTKHPPGFKSYSLDNIYIYIYYIITL